MAMVYKPEQSGQFGKAIKQLLAVRGLSQRSFAKAAGLEPDYVSKLVKGGITEPRQGTIAKIAKGLGLTVEQLQQEIQRLNSDQMTSEGEIQPRSSSQSPSQESKLDGLVQQLRSRQAAQIRSLYGQIRLLNRKLIEVDRLYVDVYLLERLSSSRLDSIDQMWRSFGIEDSLLLPIAELEPDRSQETQ